MTPDVLGRRLLHDLLEGNGEVGRRAALLGLGLLLGALVAGLAGLRLRRRVPRLLLAGCLVLACLAWLRLNGPLEGPVLLRPTVDNGLTVGDLGVLPVLLLAGALAVRRGPVSRR